MTYRLDDEGAHLDAVVSAGNEVYGACIRAGQESCRQMMGGEFSRAMALLIAPARIWARAFDAGLVTTLDNGAYQLCHALFLDWNPTSEQAKAMRGKRAASGRLGGKQKASKVLSKQLSKQEAEVCPMGTGSGFGSDPDPEGVQGEDSRPSGFRIPTPVPPPRDPEIETLARAIREDRKFSQLDAFDIAQRAMPVGNRKPLPWLLRAVSEAARDTPPGETVQAIQKRLGAYLSNARRPREEEPAKGEQKGGSAYREFPPEPPPKVDVKANGKRAAAVLGQLMTGIGKPAIEDDEAKQASGGER